MLAMALVFVLIDAVLPLTVALSVSSDCDTARSGPAHACQRVMSVASESDGDEEPKRASMLSDVDAAAWSGPAKASHCEISWASDNAGDAEPNRASMESEVCAAAKSGP